MGFWGTLGNILKPAVKFIPGVGPAIDTALDFVDGGKGILDTVGDIAGAVSPVLGKAAEGRAAGQRSEASDQLARDNINLGADRHRVDSAIGRNNALESAFKLNQGLGRDRLATGARASLAGAAPVKLNWGGPGSGLKGQKVQATGGFMDRDPRLSQLADSVMEKALSDQLAGIEFTPDVSEMESRFGGATPAPKSGVIDKALGVGSFGAGILGAVNEIAKSRKKPAGKPKPYEHPADDNVND